MRRSFLSVAKTLSGPRDRAAADYTRDALPLRLAGLAADLGRVASSAGMRRETRRPQPCWRKAVPDRMDGYRSAG